MLPLRTAHALLVLSSVILAVALYSLEPLNVGLAVALHVIVGQLVGQAMVNEGAGRPARVRVRARDDD